MQEVKGLLRILKLYFTTNLALMLRLKTKYTKYMKMARKHF